MRTRIDSVVLVGTERSIEFSPGLNIITGPITSGKTTVLRLCRALLGSGISGFPVEVRQSVRAIAGRLALGDETYRVVRPFVSTPTAKVDIAGDTETLRLPALQLDPTASETYGQWLLAKLNLPRLEVPSAPTLPESASTPVSINDYLRYCELTQDEIDNSVFEHHDPFKNIKRRYVFEILYGKYDVEVAQLQEELRNVAGRLQQLRTQTNAFTSFLQQTAWASREELGRQLATAERELFEVEEQTVANSAPATPPAAAALRSQVAELDAQQAQMSAAIAREDESVSQLDRLASQLEAQSSRLTRSIVAETLLLGFEFVVCPRCGTNVDVARAANGTCGLCLQHVSPRVTREDLVREQDRLANQITETRDLMAARRGTLTTMRHELRRIIDERATLGKELDFQMASYVSDSASTLSARAAARAELRERIVRLTDYASLFAKLDAALGDVGQLEARRHEIQARIDAAGLDQSEVETRILRLEQNFGEILDRFQVPRFGDEIVAAIDRRTYLPVVDGRRFDELSSQGLQVLVNVAHALAHHVTALELGMPLPAILMMDGLTSNVGHEGFDWDRVRDVYDYLIELNVNEGSRLQIIVADNDIPQQAEPYVRLRLSESDRLIPSPG